MLPVHSHACSCLKPFNAETRYEDSVYVFEARITEAKLTELMSENIGMWEGDMQSEFVIGNFLIKRSWKGDLLNINGVITHEQSGACGVALIPGNSYLFFIRSEWVDNRSWFSSKKYGAAVLCSTVPTYGDTYKSTINWLENKIEAMPNNAN